MSQPGESNQPDSDKIQPGEINRVDVCIAMDVTGSMGKYLNASRDTVSEAFDTLHTLYPECEFYLSFVGYRDYGDSERFNVAPLTKDIKSVRQYISDVVPEGGDDTAEDVAGALEQISQLDWKGQVKTVFFVTDAPAHGTDYHPITTGDRYPRGDPDGRIPTKQMAALASRGIDFTIFRVTPEIDKMIEQFDVAYKHDSATGLFTVLDVEKQLHSVRKEYDDEMMDRCCDDMDRCLEYIPSDYSSYENESCVTLSKEVTTSDIFKSGLIAIASGSVERRKK